MPAGQFPAVSELLLVVKADLTGVGAFPCARRARMAPEQLGLRRDLKRRRVDGLRLEGVASSQGERRLLRAVGAVADHWGLGHGVRRGGPGAATGRTRTRTPAPAPSGSPATTTGRQRAPAGQRDVAPAGRRTGPPAGIGALPGDVSGEVESAAPAVSWGGPGRHRAAPRLRGSGGTHRDIELGRRRCTNDGVPARPGRALTPQSRDPRPGGWPVRDQLGLCAALRPARRPGTGQHLGPGRTPPGMGVELHQRVANAARQPTSPWSPTTVEPGSATERKLDLLLAAQAGATNVRIRVSRGGIA